MLDKCERGNKMALEQKETLFIFPSLNNEIQANSLHYNAHEAVKQIYNEL